MKKKIFSIIAIIFFMFGLWSFNILKTIDFSEIEKKIVYKPTKETYKLIPVLAKKAKENSFISKDGTKITYINIKGDKKFPVIVFCHGNAGNMTRNDNQDKIKFLVKAGYELFTLDYRGFGKSGGKVDEKGIYTDIDSFITYLNTKCKIPNSKIVLWGHSMGSAVVINEASKKKFKGVIIEGAFTSLEDMKNFRISNKRKSNFIHLLIRDSVFNNIHLTQKFASKDKITKIKSPMLIIHAIDDEMIPVEMGQHLAKLKPEAQTYFSKKGTHCNSGWQDKPILEFLNKLNDQCKL